MFFMSFVSDLHLGLATPKGPQAPPKLWVQASFMVSADDTVSLHPWRDRLSLPFTMLWLQRFKHGSLIFPPQPTPRAKLLERSLMLQ